MAAVCAQKSVLSGRYRWKKGVLSGNQQNVKCVLDVFTGVRNLRSATVMEKLIDMDSIKIRTPEFKRKQHKKNQEAESL